MCNLQGNLNGGKKNDIKNTENQRKKVVREVSK